jgi:hypothetical protein
MEKKIRQIFKNISELEPAPKLAGFILAKINRERSKIIREKKALVWAGLFGSALAAVYAVSFFGQEIFGSEFWSLASLAFSDINIVLINWNDYVLSLLETLPVINIVIILIPTFIFLLSLNLYFNSNNINTWKHQK